MMKDQELLGREWELCIRRPFIIGEFDFAGPVQQLHDGADLAAHEAALGHIYKESDDIQKLRRDVHSVVRVMG